MSVPIRQQTLLGKNTLQCHSLLSGPVAVQRRTFFNFFGKGKSKGAPTKTQQAVENPFLADIMSRKAKDSRRVTQQPQRQRGDLSTNSLFSTEEDNKKLAEHPGSRDVPDEEIRTPTQNLQDMAVALDPRPRQRELWQRRQVIKLLRKGERLTETQYQKKTERELTLHSHNFKTSVKKLAPLARQIQGKTVEEAIVQMRFSKKKVAQEVREHLEYARDKAIVSRGMGLGDAIEGTQTSKAPVEIQRKDGSRYTVTDLSNIYVDQAWVGRGPYGKLPDYRARSNVNLIRTPWTHLAVRLKEETTLVREWEKREEKRQRKRAQNVWVPLPDRPLHGQHQYYTW